MSYIGFIIAICLIFLIGRRLPGRLLIAILGLSVAGCCVAFIFVSFALPEQPSLAADAARHIDLYSASASSVLQNGVNIVHRTVNVKSALLIVGCLGLGSMLIGSFFFLDVACCTHHHVVPSTKEGQAAKRLRQTSHLRCICSAQRLNVCSLWGFVLGLLLTAAALVYVFFAYYADVAATHDWAYSPEIDRDSEFVFPPPIMNGDIPPVLMLALSGVALFLFSLVACLTCCFYACEFHASPTLCSRKHLA